jgi:hypothetical protein
MEPYLRLVAIDRANCKKGLEPVSESPYIRDPGAIVRAWPEISEPPPEVPRTRFEGELAPIAR